MQIYYSFISPQKLEIVFGAKKLVFSKRLFFQCAAAKKISATAKDFNDNEAVELLKELETKLAEHIILNALKPSKKSEAQLKRKLADALISTEIIDNIINKYKNLKLINDVDFAYSFLHDKIKFSKKSIKTAEFMLKEFGVSTENINI